MDSVTVVSKRGTQQKEGDRWEEPSFLTRHPFRHGRPRFGLEVKVTEKGLGIQFFFPCPVRKLGRVISAPIRGRLPGIDLLPQSTRKERT
jgi:hypothetical protein